MDGQSDGYNLNISQITENSSLVRENFIKTKKEIKVNIGIQERVDCINFFPIVFIHDCQFISLKKKIGWS